MIGVDVGGTKIAAGVVQDRVRVLHRVRAATPSSGGSAVLDRITELVQELIADSAEQIVAVGLGVPGAVDPDSGRVRSATDILPGWAGTEVRAELIERIGLPLTVDNDVRAVAYGQARLGAAAGYERTLFVSLGTGVGGAVLEAGEPLRGGHNTAGEIGHLLVPATGELACGCGRFDHVEAVASGPAMAADYAARTGGTGIDLSEVVHRMRSGDRTARAVITDAATLLGRALSGLVTALDVDAIVLGGGVAALGSDLIEPLSRALDAETVPPARHTPILSSDLGTDAPILGAALRAAHHLDTIPGAHA